MAVMQHGIALASILCAMFHSTIHLPSNILLVYNNHNSVSSSQPAASCTPMQHPTSCFAETDANGALQATPLVRGLQDTPRDSDHTQSKDSDRMQTGCIDDGVMKEHTASDEHATSTSFTTSTLGTSSIKKCTDATTPGPLTTCTSGTTSTSTTPSRTHVVTSSTSSSTTCNRASTKVSTTSSTCSGNKAQ
eukprot:1659502-Amphidinium_carterae.1